MKEKNSIIDDLILSGQRTVRVGKVFFYTNQIVCYEFYDDIFIEIEDVKELAQATEELTGGIIPVLNLSITGQRNNISTEAFSFNVHKELNIKQKTLAEAVVIDNLATRIMANFYYKVVKKDHVVKVFDKKKEAINWLLSKNFNEQ